MTLKKAFIRVNVTCIIVSLLISSSSPADTEFRFGTPHPLGFHVNDPPAMYASGPDITADGLSLYYSWSDVRVATRASLADSWEGLQPVPGLQSSMPDKHPSITADGLTIVIQSKRPGGLGGFDLWMSTRNDTDSIWTTPVHLGSEINSYGFERDPEISADGLSLFFSSDRGRGTAAHDLYVARRATTSDPFGAPVKLDSAINLDGRHESMPTISDDERILMFWAGDLSTGVSGVYVSSRLRKTDPWGPAAYVGGAVDFPGEEYHPEISPDKSTLYLSRSLDGGCCAGLDIWEIPIEAFTFFADGDINEDGTLDVGDLEELRRQVRSPTEDLAFDINLDGNLDPNDWVYWIETLKHTWYGDANLNGEFNTGDLVQVLEVGKYETSEDAGWSAGDWNGDGVFDTGDLVKALEDGGYEKGPRTEAAAVPEPGVWMLCLVAMTLLWLTRR